MSQETILRCHFGQSDFPGLLVVQGSGCRVVRELSECVVLIINMIAIHRMKSGKSYQSHTFL